MPNIYQQAQSFRRDLETGANNTAALMIQAYGELWATRIKPEIDDLTAEIEEDIAQGKDPKIARLERQARFAQLEQDIANEMERLRSQFADMIANDVKAVADRAMIEAQALMTAGINPPPGVNVAGVFNRLNTGAYENIVGVLQPGSPLRKVLDPLGDDAASAVGRALKHGVALGHGPRQTAREARQALGGNMARALTIARTETIRAYREASRATYAANPDIVRSWVWLSARQARTCAVCWSMHGTDHPTDQPLGSHPNCRCTMVPQTRPYGAIAREYGLPPPPEGWPGGPDVKALVGNGAELFAKLSEEDQLRILGPSKFAAYKAGALKLGDLVAERNDPDWGLVRGEKSLGVLGLPRVKMGDALEQRTPVSEEAQIRQQIADIAIEAQARIKELEDQVAALEASYKELIEEKRRLFPGGPKTEEDRAAFAAITQKRLKALEEIEKAKKTHQDFLDSVTARQRALLYVNNPASVKPIGGKTATTRHANGVDGFNRLVSASTIDPNHQYAVPTIQAIPSSGRSSYDYYGTVKLSHDSDRVVVHEFGHWWEHQNPQAHQSALDFYDRRTAGEDAHWLGGDFGRSEVGRLDQFIHPYMGKDLTHPVAGRYATEIVSMGLEWFYANPQELAERDPDYFDFIFNLVRGRY